MDRSKTNSVRSFCLCALISLGGFAQAGTDVLMSRFNPDGTGANLSEKNLTVSNVNPANFGKLFSYEIEGFAYAQPLIVSDLFIKGRLRNVLYVATMSNVIYALDADDPGPQGGLLWSVRFSDGGAFPVPDTIDPPNAIDLSCLPRNLNCLPYGHRTVQGSFGIFSTPVIDKTRNALFLVTHTIEGSKHVQRLHALDILSGQEKPGSPTIIEGKKGVHQFDPRIEGNRASLPLAGSSVVIAWNSLRKDLGDYHGFVMSYDADSLKQTGVFCTTCMLNESGGGIWQSGRPPVVEDGRYVYFFVGNGWAKGKTGSFSAGCDIGMPRPADYFAESLIKLDTSNGLRLVGFWTPENWCTLDQNDADLGGSGPILITSSVDRNGMPLAMGGGKDGRLFMIDTCTLTPPFNQCNPAGFVDLDPEPEPGSGYKHHIMGGPVYWRRGKEIGGSRIFVSTETNFVSAFHLAESSSGSPPASLTPLQASPFQIIGHPGAILSLSADGDKPGTGILWMTFASDNTSDFPRSAVFDTKPGRLAALDAENLSRVLWHSDMNPDRDGLGYFAKFTPPTIANGKVYAVSAPRPESYAWTVDKEGSDFFRQSYHAPNSIGYVMVYGHNPVADPPVISFSALFLPAVLYPLTGPLAHQ
jgi:hypothetical protein